MSLVLKNAAFVITQDHQRQILKNKDILIENGRIARIGDNIQGEEKIDCSKRVLMPGLINCHTHASMALFRGIGDDMCLQDWLQKRIFPVESKMNREDIYWGAMLAGLEMLESGTTTFVDMYYHMDKVAEACEQLGVRGYLGTAIVDFPSPDAKNQDEGLKKTKDLVKSRSELVAPTVQPHSIYLCSKETLLKCKETADKYGLLMHMHISETKKEVADCEKEHKARPIEYLEKIGLLTNRLLFAHGVWLSKEECSLLGKHKSSLAHNPSSNMKLATGGITPLTELFDAGVKVGIGTDGAVSNNNLDMFESMKFAALYQKAYRVDPTVLPAPKILDMATIDGALALGRKDLGSIEVGKTADIIGLDLSSPRLRPLKNLMSHIVYSAGGPDVNLVVTQGRVRVNGKLENREGILEKVEEQAQKLIQRAGL